MFRAAVSAFCAITRPSRREIAQLDDLTLPLIDSVSRESRRFAAAALSECEHAPRELVRRLANDVADVAAPLLIRSKSLRDVDLISLIANCGLSHARAIARRPGLAKPIHNLLKAMKDPEIDRLRTIATSDGSAGGKPVRGELAEAARRKLRAMMRPANVRSHLPGLRETALSGRPALFQTALADALGLGFDTARRVTEAPHLTDFSIALKALDIEPEMAFMLISAVRPDEFRGAEQIRWFVARYDTLMADKAWDKVRDWKAEAAVPFRQAS